MSILNLIATVGLLIVAATVAKGVAAEVPDGSLLVSLNVVEPARWLVRKPGNMHGEDESVRVSYHELDLSNDADVSKLYERLRNASERVCGLNVRTQRKTSSEKNLCFSGALAKAVANVNLPSLSKKHSG